MASDHDVPGQFQMSIGDESITRAVHAEISHMTLDEAIASGPFDLPDEPGMVRIPVTINVEIPWHLLYPPEPPAVPHVLEELYDIADEEEGETRRLHANAEFIFESLREM